jgi:hypothetical protein
MRTGWLPAEGKQIVQKTQARRGVVFMLPALALFDTALYPMSTKTFTKTPDEQTK